MRDQVQPVGVTSIAVRRRSRADKPDYRGEAGLREHRPLRSYMYGTRALVVVRE